MESKHGRFDDMEERLHSGNFRQKSKVPRARFQQRCEYSEYSLSENRSGSLKSSVGFHQSTSSSSSHQADTDEYKEWQLLIGERVCISGVKQGVLRYYGRTNFAQGFWCGVELDEPVGKNNGTVNGFVYFTCKPNHGIFAPVSKVSRLNDLNIDWRMDSRKDSYSRQSDQFQSSSNWDYNARYPTETMDSKFIKNSPSDPTFMRPVNRSNLPHKSESFPYDKRSITEQREHHVYTVKDLSSETLDVTSKRGKVQGGSMSTKNSSWILSKYGYGANNQFFNSKAVCLDEKDETCDSKRDQFVTFRSEQSVPKKMPVKASSQNIEKLTAMEDYEHFFHTPTNSGDASPQAAETKRFNDIDFFDYKIPEDLLSAFQSRDFPDPEDDMDNDDQMSGDFDESLGILTPSQMDFTLCPDLPTSCTDIRGMDFPSSESFDDINDLPEDEQVHDVSVKYLPESSSAKRVLEVAKQVNSGNFVKSENSAEDSKLSSMVSSTDKFLFSISQKTFDDFNLDSHYLTSSDSSANAASKQCETATKLNNLSAINVLGDRTVEKELPDKLNLELEPFASVCTKESMLTTNVVCSATSDAALNQFSVLASGQGKIQTKQHESHNLSDNNKIALRNLSDVDMSRKNYDTDSSRDSLLQAESEHTSTLKEKLTVSWEDCVSQNNDCMFTPVERPESVYTVASSDTGFQEDAEMDADGCMATSIDSTEGNKRFSTASRDSCIVTEEVDGYKIAESNSTSGYSTGLSDSCCNDRAEDDMSGKPMTDEEIQDSVGPCDSEDAFSFHENSLSKDGEVVTAEESDVTGITALCHDSTSEALCETMVEDATLTEINELLMSPEDNQKVLEDKENNEVQMDQSKDIISESSSVKTSDKTASSVSAVSTPKSTPEKKLNVNNRAKTESQRNQRTTLNRNARSKICDDDGDRKKQLVKSPKKNVMSKIKAMIEATSCKTSNRNKPENEVVQKRVPSAPKKSRWEAVTSKIAASLAEEKTKPKAKKEIKGRVDTNLALARQQATICKSPKLDSRGEGSISPVSVSSRRPLSERNSAPNSVKDGRMGRVGTGTSRDTKHRAKSPRPSRACITSRSNSPVANSESSTSVSLTSHNSRSKIAHWKGSTSTVASSAPPSTTVTVKRQITVPPTKPPLQTTRATGQRMVAKKPTPACTPRITLQPPGTSRIRSLSPAGRQDGREKQHKREQPSSRGAQPSSKGPVRPPMWLSKAELTQEIQRLGTLCEARTKELNRLKMETKHVSVGFDAFAALFKYMVEDLNALSVPNLTKDLEKTLKQLELTKQDLAFYEREVEEIKSHHCQELNDLSNKLFEVYQSEVAELNAKHQEEINHLKNDHQKQIEHVTATFDATSAEAKAQHEKLVASLEQELLNQRAEFQLLQERDIRDLEEKHAEGTKMLQEHVEQLQKKCAELKQHSMSMEDAMRKDTDSKLQWVSSAKLDLEKEVESLKTVLEMKNKELHILRVQNLEMEKQLEELPIAREKIKMLQARAEDLEALMIEKTKIERKLSTENQQMRDTYEKEAKVNRRLSMENEELQWRLRQAENSIISGSFSEVPEFPEAEENLASPIKSPGPQMLSRSVFFTFMDKDESMPHSPRTQYKKITPNFSNNYKTSPAKSSKSPPAPSPQRRAKSHSEPPQPIITSTPRKNAKLPLGKSKGSQKRQRSGSDMGKQVGDPAEGGSSSVADSMASSISSESSVFENRDRLLEENREHIIHSLEILREQRSVEMSVDEVTMIEKKWRSDDIKVTGELSTLGTEDMSRSAEFADPKTYYHMTFPVLKEAGDIEDSCKNPSCGNSPVKEVMPRSKHSKSVDNINSSAVAADEQVMSMSTQESSTNNFRGTDVHTMSMSMQESSINNFIGTNEQVMSMSTQETSSTNRSTGADVNMSMSVQDVCSVRVSKKRSSCTELTVSTENVQKEDTSNNISNSQWRTI